MSIGTGAAAPVINKKKLKGEKKKTMAEDDALGFIF